MPNTGTKSTRVKQHFVPQSVGWQANTAGAGKVEIAAVSSGVTVPISGTISATISGTVSVSNQHTVNVSVINTPLSVAAGTVDAHLVGGTTNQDIRIAAVSASVTALPVTGSVTVNNNTFDVDPQGTASFNSTEVSTSSGTKTATLVGSPGSTTAIQVRGFGVFNESQTWLRMELRFGSTAFWEGGVPGCGGALNWNLIGHYQLSGNNKSVIAYIASAGTAVFSCYYRTA